MYFYIITKVFVIICKMLFSFRNYVEETILVISDSDIQIKFKDRGKSQGRSTFLETEL